MTKKRKIIVLSCMVALLVVTAVFNFILTGDNTVSDSSQVVSSSSYFSQYRNERLTTRNQELLELDEIINSDVSTDINVQDAINLKTQITIMSEKELLLESLIKAYGFSDVVVVMGLDSESVNVIAKTDNLSNDDAIIIYNIISEEGISSPENVKIIPIS